MFISIGTGIGEFLADSYIGYRNISLFAYKYISTMYCVWMSRYELHEKRNTCMIFVVTIHLLSPYVKAIDN